MEAGRQLPLEKDVEHDFQCSSSRADLSKLNIDAIGAGENGGFIKEAAKDQKQNSQQEPNRSQIKALKHDLQILNVNLLFLEREMYGMYTSKERTRRITQKVSTLQEWRKQFKNVAIACLGENAGISMLVPSFEAASPTHLKKRKRVLENCAQERNLIARRRNGKQPRKNAGKHEEVRQALKQNRDRPLDKSKSEDEIYDRFERLEELPREVGNNIKKLMWKNLSRTILMNLKTFLIHETINQKRFHSLSPERFMFELTLQATIFKMIEILYKNKLIGDEEIKRFLEGTEIKEKIGSYYGLNAMHNLKLHETAPSPFDAYKPQYEWTYLSEIFKGIRENDPAIFIYFDLKTRVDCLIHQIGLSLLIHPYFFKAAEHFSKSEILEYLKDPKSLHDFTNQEKEIQILLHLTNDEPGFGNFKSSMIYYLKCILVFFEKYLTRK